MTAIRRAWAALMQYGQIQAGCVTGVYLTEAMIRLIPEEYQC